jgi:hypothetical protein
MCPKPTPTPSRPSGGTSFDAADDKKYCPRGFSSAEASWHPSSSPTKDRTWAALVPVSAAALWFLLAVWFFGETRVGSGYWWPMITGQKYPPPTVLLQGEWYLFIVMVVAVDVARRRSGPRILYWVGGLFGAVGSYASGVALCRSGPDSLESFAVWSWVEHCAPGFTLWLAIILGAIILVFSPRALRRADLDRSSLARACAELGGWLLLGWYSTFVPPATYNSFRILLASVAFLGGLVAAAGIVRIVGRRVAVGLSRYLERRSGQGTV